MVVTQAQQRKTIAMADSLCDDLNGEERTEELFNRIKFTFDLPVDEAALRLGTCILHLETTRLH